MQTERRPARAQDLSTICALQIASWQGAYRGMVSDAFLDHRVKQVLTQRWAKMPGPEWIVDCIWQDKTLLGFITVDRTHDGGPYVDNLHVTRAAQGQGIGRALMAGAARQLTAEGLTTLWLTVIAVNHPSRAFYRRVGGQEGAEFDESLFGEPLRAIPVHWSDLPALAALETR